MPFSISITDRPCEVGWFSALCDDDYEYLGIPDVGLQSSFAHCRDITLTAESGGLDNILLPSGYALGIDTVAFAAAVAPQLRSIKLLTAIRCGEMWPPQQARQLATLDQMLSGRLSVNIISSDLPGETLPSAPRYRRTLEYMTILRTLLEEGRSTSMASSTSCHCRRRGSSRRRGRRRCSTSAGFPRMRAKPPLRVRMSI